MDQPGHLWQRRLLIQKLCVHCALPDVVAVLPGDEVYRHLSQIQPFLV